MGDLEGQRIIAGFAAKLYRYAAGGKIMRKTIQCSMLIFSSVLIGGVFKSAQAQEDTGQIIGGIQIEKSGVIIDPQSRDKLIAIARGYFREQPMVYFDEKNVDSAEPEQVKSILSDLKWFMDHIPAVHHDTDQGGERYLYSHRHFLATWRYMPGCVDKGNYWTTPTGFPCAGGFGVSVLMNEKLQPDRLVIDTLK
jgi:hypothetical protein